MESAAHRPGAVVHGHEAYAGLDRKAAALLDLNAVDLDAPDDPAYESVMSVALRDHSIDEIAAALAFWQ